MRKREARLVHLIRVDGRDPFRHSFDYLRSVRTSVFQHGAALGLSPCWPAALTLGDYDSAADHANFRGGAYFLCRILTGRQSFGLGAGKLRTIFSIVLPSAVPGILSGVVLAIGAYRRRDGGASFTPPERWHRFPSLYEGRGVHWQCICMYFPVRAFIWMNHMPTAVVLLVLVRCAESNCRIACERADQQRKQIESRRKRMGEVKNGTRSRLKIRICIMVIFMR